MTVASIDARSFVEAFEVREVLEGLAARLCCERISREDLRELRRLADQAYDLLVEGNPEIIPRQTVLDRGFHRSIIEIADNRMLDRLTQHYRALGPVAATLASRLEGRARRAPGHS